MNVSLRQLFPPLVAVLLVLWPSSAYSHVDVTPKRAPAGSDARLTLIVENERDTAGTREVVVQLPQGITSVEGRALKGWKLRLRPADGAPRRMILTSPRGKELTGHEAVRFRLLVGLPSTPGKRITFKVLQEYDNGEVVRWIGPPGGPDPAPTLRLTAPKEPPPEPAAETEQPPPPAASSQDNTSGDEEGGDSAALPIALGIGAVVLAVAGGVALARRRRTKT